MKVNKDIREIEKSIKEISDKMIVYAQYALPFYQGDDKEYKCDKYYRLKKQYNELIKVRNDILDKEAQEARKETKQKKFVNGYGEATKRYITNKTYESSMRKTSKRVLKNMGY